MESDYSRISLVVVGARAMYETFHIVMFILKSRNSVKTSFDYDLRNIWKIFEKNWKNKWEKINLYQ